MESPIAIIPHGNYRDTGYVRGVRGPQGHRDPRDPRPSTDYEMK